MPTLFYLAVYATIFSALALASTLLLARRSRSATQRIREISHRGRSYRTTSPLTTEAWRRLFNAIHWVRAKFGLADAADLPERLANAGYKGTFPPDVYNAIRILGPNGRHSRRLIGSFEPARLDDRASGRGLHPA